MRLQVGKHGLIIEFTDPDYNVRRSGTYLPEVAAHEGEHLSATYPSINIPQFLKLLYTVT
uniref:Uncharacterized protein n=1 Tax=Aegilops tauschii subsp. strangulata TaxID=200361 RepID=A0A452YQ24_AEGTS